MHMIQQGFYFVLTLSLSLSGQMMLKRGLATLMDTRSRTLSEFVRHHLLSIVLSPYIWLGVVLCGLGLVCWLLILSMFDLGRALPILGGMACVAVFFLGRIFLHEQTQWIHLAGILLIVTGIYLASLPSKPAGTEAHAAPAPTHETSAHS